MTPLGGMKVSATGEQGVPTAKVFERKASGLVRQLSIVDLLLYGILCTGTITTVWWFYPFAQYVGGGVNVALGILVFYPLLFVPIALVYAGLGSAMPRAGGDFVYVSRILHPLIGFAFVMGWFVIFWIVTLPMGGLALVQMGIQTLLNVIGFETGNSGLVDAATAAGGQTWMLLTALAIVAVVFVVTVRGMALFRKIQKYFVFPAITVSLVTVVVLLLTSSHADVVARINEWGRLTMNDPNLYGHVLKTAYAHGFNQQGGVNWWQTWVFMTVPMGYMAYIVYGAQGLLGEVKNANNFRMLALGILTAGVFVFVVLGLVAALFQSQFSLEWVNASAYCYNNSLIHFPFVPSVLYWVSVLSSSPVPAFLIFLGVLASAYVVPQAAFLNATRVITGMAMDGVLPDWFSRVSKKSFAPVNAAIFYFLVAMAFTIPFVYWTSFYYVVVSAASIGYIGGYVASGAAAVAFPFRRRQLYLSAPVSNFRIGPVPLISVFGALLTAMALAMATTIFFVPELGATGRVPRLVVTGTLIGAAVWYLVYGAYRRWTGGMAGFIDLPPE